MDDVVVRRVVGVVTLAVAAFLLSWLLPRPGLDRLREADERVVTMDLTRPDSLPQESIAPVPDTEHPPSGPDGPDGPQAIAPAPGQQRTGPPVAPAPVPPVAAQDPAPPPSAPDPVEVVVLPKLDPATGPRLAPKPETKPETKPVAKPVPKPEAVRETRPAPEARPAANARPATPGSSAGPSGKVMLQAGAYSMLDKAEDARKRASAGGVSCFIAPAETAKGTLYRLRCGPFPDRAKADAAVKTLSADGIAAQVVSGG